MVVIYKPETSTVLLSRCVLTLLEHRLTYVYLNVRLISCLNTSSTVPLLGGIRSLDALHVPRKI
jgi:hypothetical protein